MSTAELARIQAPVAYTEVRKRVNTVRALLGVVLVVLALAGMIQANSRWSVVVAAYLVGDGLMRRNRGTSALPMLLTDTIVFAGIELLKGAVGISLAVTFLPPDSWITIAARSRMMGIWEQTSGSAISTTWMRAFRCCAVHPGLSRMFMTANSTVNRPSTM